MKKHALAEQKLNNNNVSRFGKEEKYDCEQTASI